jgi:hypothetical protein
MLGSSQYLHPFLREVSVKPGQRQPRAVNSRLPNFAMESDLRPFQLHLQLFGMTIVKALDRDDWDALLLIACRCNRLGPELLRHQD